MLNAWNKGTKTKGKDGKKEVVTRPIRFPIQGGVKDAADKVLVLVQSALEGHGLSCTGTCSCNSRLVLLLVVAADQNLRSDMKTVLSVGQRIVRAFAGTHQLRVLTSPDGFLSLLGP